MTSRRIYLIRHNRAAAAAAGDERRRRACVLEERRAALVRMQGEEGRGEIRCYYHHRLSLLKGSPLSLSLYTLPPRRVVRNSSLPLRLETRGAPRLNTAD